MRYVSSEFKFFVGPKPVKFTNVQSFQNAPNICDQQIILNVKCEEKKHFEGTNVPKKIF